MVSRKRELSKILQEGGGSGELFIEQVPLEDVIKTQAGNFRHRWDGLSVRLADAAKRGETTPTKRIKPGSVRVSLTRKLTVRWRQKSAGASHDLFAQAKRADNYSIFFSGIKKYTDRIRFLQMLEALKDFKRAKILIERKLEKAFKR